MIYLLIAVILYFVFQGHKLQQVELKKPEPATPVQKKSLVVLLIGSATTAMSPLSTAGGLLLTGCPDNIEDGNKIFNGMFSMAVTCMVVLVLAAFLGMFGLWGLF